MKSDFIRLSWDDTEHFVLPVDAYIEHDGLRYSLLEPYEPEQKDERHFHYEPLFHHPKMYLGKVPFVRPSKDTDANDITLMEWSYTGYVGTLLGYFCEQISAVFNRQEPELFVAELMGQTNDIVSVTFSTNDILSALTNLANQLDCEWHIDWSLNRIYFGHISIPTVETQTLEVGENVGAPSARDSKEGYWNAFLAQGSTRNITRRAASGEYVQSNVRLSLDKTKYPDGIIYTDEDGNIISSLPEGTRAFTKSLIFDDVYPKLNLYVYNVRQRERYFMEDDNGTRKKVVDHYDSEGKPVYKRYSVWYIRLAAPDSETTPTSWTDYELKNIITLTYQGYDVRREENGMYYMCVKTSYTGTYTDITPNATANVTINGKTYIGSYVFKREEATVCVNLPNYYPTSEAVLNGYPEITALQSGTEVKISGDAASMFPGEMRISNIVDGKEPVIAFQPNLREGALDCPLAGRGSGDGDGHYGFKVIFHDTPQTIEAGTDDDIDTGIEILAGDFEIVFEQSNDLIIPTTEAKVVNGEVVGGGIVPKGYPSPSILANKVNIYNVAVEPEYETAAQAELEEKTKKEILETFKDTNTYTVKAYPDVFEAYDRNVTPPLFIGQKVLFKNADYLLETRVMKLVTKMDYSFEQEISVGNKVIKGAQQQLKEQVQTLVSAGAAGEGGGGGISSSAVLSLIKEWVTPRFLSKTGDDTANGFITFVKGLWSKAEARIDGLLTALNIKSDNISSSNYTGDGMADTGWSITNSGANGRSKMVIDELYVRMKAVFEELEVKKRTVTGGDETWSLAANRIVRTDYIHVENEEEEELGYSYYNMPWTLSGNKFMFALRRLSNIFGWKKKVRVSLKSEDLSKINYVRCYFLAELDGQAVDNMWMTGDLARCQTFNLSAQSREGGVNPTNVPSEDGTGHYNRAQNTFWWRKVLHAADTENYQVKEIDGVKYHWFDVAYNDPNNEAAGSDLPCAGDAVSQFGNDHNPERMNVVCIEINGSANADAPCIKAYRGIYTFDLKQCWWGGQSCMKMKLSPATGYQFYGPLFEFITEYGTEKVQQDRPEVYWTAIALDRDDKVQTYPEYSDDIVGEESRTRFDGTGMRNVRKCFYYDRVSHHGSVWLCVFPNDGFHWRVKVHKEGEPSNAFTYKSVTYNEGDIVPDNVYGSLSTENKTKCEHVRNYITDEPSDSSASWKKQVEKGDNGQFMSRAFCRTNLDISNVTPTGGTAQSPIPDAMTVSGQQIVWHDGAPDGLEMLWSTTAWFMPDGQHSQWTKPARETDTQTQDIEFSPNETKPDDPYGDDASQKDSSTYRTERHKQGWYDPTNDANSLPSRVTWSDMIWRAERKIKNGAYSGGWTVSRIKGESANRLDLDNEMDMIQTDSAGKVMVERTVSTIVRLFEGTRKVSMNVADVSVTVKNASGTTVTLNTTKNPSTGTTTDLTLSWRFSADARMSSVYEITVKYTYKNVEYSAVFTIAASMGQPIYQLKPSLSSINFSRTDTNTLTPPSRTLVMSVMKIDGASTRELTIADSGMTVRYSTSSMPTTASGGRAWGESDGTTGITWSNGNMNISNTVTIGDVFVAMFNSNNTLLDRETIPVLKDGKNGENSIRVDLDNEHEDFLYDDAGNRVSDTVTSQARLYDGMTQVIYDGSNITWRINDGNGNTWSTSTSTNATATINEYGLLTVSGINVTSAKIKVRAFYNGHYYYAEFTSNKKKQDKYELIVEPNAIPYNISETWSEQGVTVKASRLSIDGTKTENIYLNSGSIKVAAKYKSSASGTAVWHVIGDNTQASAKSFTITSAIVQNNDNILIELRKEKTSGGYDVSDSSTYTVEDYETIPINRAKNGENALIADLSNEMDSVAMTYDGKTTAATLYTTFRMFYGSSPQELISLTYSGEQEGISVTTNRSSGVVTVSVSDGYELTDDKCVIRITGICGKGTRYADFTIQGVRAGEDGEHATTYQLVPSDNEIVEDPNNNNARVPSTVTCSCVSIKNGVVSNNPIEATIQYSFNGTGWTTGSSVSTSDSNLTSKLYFQLKVNNEVVDKETIPVVVSGKDAHEVQPNILLRTVFDNGIDFVKEAWESNKHWSSISVSSSSSYTVAGHQSILLDASGMTGHVDFKQNVYGRVKTDTWYTLSFYSTNQGRLYLSDQSGSTAWIDRANVIFDGVKLSNVSIDGRVWLRDNSTPTKHVLTFKTNSSFSTQTLMIIFSATSGGSLYICMPKLELGQYATAYLPNDSDLVGVQGLQGCVVRVSEWAAEQDYRNDEGATGLTVGYIDVVAIADSSEGVGYKFYKCKLSHTSSNSNKPVNATYWEGPLTDIGAIYTSLLIAKDAHIKFGTGNQFVITDTDNKIQAGMKGDGDIRIWAGGSNITNANDTNLSEVPFRVYDDGSVVMTDSDIEGIIKSGKYTEYSQTKYANELNDNGSGHLAKGNIEWDEDGNTEFRGTLKAISLYQEYQDLSEDKTINISEGTYIIAESRPSTYDSIVITIPDARFTHGATLTIVSPVADSNPNYGVYNFPKIQNTISGFYTKKGHSGSYRIRSFKTVANLVIKLHSIAGSWFLDTEEDYLTDIVTW